jgi:hypothetical protein
MAKSKFFRAFVEGQTISDGRKITGEMIDQIVATFNVDTYSPRINIEHIAGYSPEPPFNGYGDVVAVRAQLDDIVIDGKPEKRKALYAQVEGNKQLVKLAADGQKPYPSVELTDSYAGTAKVGLVGLAFTDKPASIATQKLQFSRTAPGTVFSAADDAVEFEFEAEPAQAPDATGMAAAFSQAMAGFLAKFKPVEPVTPPAPSNDNPFDPGAFAAEIGKAVASTMESAIAPFSAQVTAAAAESAKAVKAVADLRTELEATPAGQFKRTPATGGSGRILADC